MRRRHAFTLVELLVVIGIIALLIGILMPALNRARAMSRQTKCLSNLRQIGIVNAMYVNEWKGWCLPGHWGWSPSPPGTPGGSFVPPAGYAAGVTDTWHGWVNVYDFERALTAERSGSSYTTYFPAGLVCPEASYIWTIGQFGGYPINYSYGMNTSDQPSPAPIFWTGWKINQIRSASDKIFFTDAIGDVSYGGNPAHSLKYLDTALGGAGWGESYLGPTVGNQSNILCYRHRLGANVLYFDGHGDWQTYNAIWFDNNRPTDPRWINNLRQWRPQKP